MVEARHDSRRAVPRTDTVLADPRLLAARDHLGSTTVKRAVTAAQEQARRGEIAPNRVADTAVATLPATATTLRPVLNATGVVLHTNLGRAALGPSVRTALDVAAGYLDVEFDLVTGRRAARGRGACAALRDAVPDAEDALVVNNGAAALVLAAAALGAGRELMVSRGELVEIGDGFRLPDLLTSTGARLREVGTTNSTVLADYAAAVGEDTAAILKIHPSNFRLEGFTHTVTVRALARLGPPVVVDIGSGLLESTPLLPREPDAASALRAGAALVTASGDKLLGGPQAGLVLGRRDLVARLRRHPIARVLRLDKLRLAALEATLRGPPTPTHVALHADGAGLRERADKLAGRLHEDGIDVTVAPSDGVVGGGGAPGVRLPGWAVSLPASYHGPLRAGRPPVVGRVERGRCLLDLRCVPPTEDASLAGAVVEAAAVVADARDAAAR